MPRPRIVPITLLLALAAVAAPPATFPAPAADPPAAEEPAADKSAAESQSSGAPAGAPAGAPPAAKPASPPPAPPKLVRNIGGPGDYGLRERLVKRLWRDQEIAAVGVNVALVNGGVVLSGTMPTWAVRRRALIVASTERGIINVTDQMDVARGDVKDSVIQKGLTDVLKDLAPAIELKEMEVTVEDGVATLRGTVKDFASRVRAEEAAGSVLGVTRIANRLRPVTAPNGGPDDASIRKAVAGYLKNFREFGFLGEIEVKVQDAKVTLTGSLPLFLGRQQAGTMVALVGGVREVDNRIKTDPGLQPEVLLVKELP